MNLENIMKYVESKLANESSGHDYLHALRVLKNAELLVEGNDVNKEVIFISCLIHDLIDDKLDDINKETKNNIVEKLKTENINKNDITHIISIIENMSYSKGKKLNTLEGEIVQDADRLDALGAIGIARTFAFGGKKGRLIYNPNSLNDTDSLSHFHQKLYKLVALMNTKKGREIAVNRTNFMKDFEKKLLREIQ